MRAQPYMRSSVEEDYKLPRKNQTPSDTGDGSPAMFWECARCHASVLYMIDDCPRCAEQKK